MKNFPASFHHSTPQKAQFFTLTTTIIRRIKIDTKSFCSLRQSKYNRKDTRATLGISFPSSCKNDTDTYQFLTREGNEIPNVARVSFLLLFALTERTKGFGIYFDPTYNSGSEGKKIELFAESNDGTKQGKFFSLNV